MSRVFAAGQGPADVIRAVMAQGPRQWGELDAADQALGVAKLRLAGVYDDRQEGCFMLRLRIPGGRTSAEQLAAVASIVTDLTHRPPGSDGPDRLVEITTRQDLQLHWVRFESLPEIWDRLATVGLTTEQACGDTLRNVTACPVDGIDADAVLGTEPVVAALGELARDEAELTAFLPRKFKVAVTGCPTDCVSARLHDLAFTPARRNRALGFHVHAGGGLSDSPRLASLLDMFVTPGQVPAVVRAALHLYAERGNFQDKAVNRFRVLVHKLGSEAVAAQIRQRLPDPLPAAGADLSTWQPADHIGIHLDRSGDHYVGLCVPLGRLSVEDLAEVARLAREYGTGRVRLTQRQNLVLAGVTDLAGLRAEPLLRRLRPDPDPFERAVLACTSAPFCKFGIANVKGYGAELIDHLREEVPRPAWERLDGLRVHLSGCKASCAQVQAAHIGLRATMAATEDGYVEAFDVALNGDVAAGRVGKWTALAVPAAQAFTATGQALARSEDSDHFQWEEG